MTEVLSFVPKRPNIFVCNCGCSSFEFYNDGSVTCALCFERIDSLSGAWDVPAAPLRPPEADARVREVSGNGDAAFARRVILRRGEGEDAVAVIVIRDDGSTHLWTSVDTRERTQWLKRRIWDVRSMLPK
jgi:hypothetical protein